jgi:hypothetical protein
MKCNFCPRYTANAMRARKGPVAQLHRMNTRQRLVWNETGRVRFPQAAGDGWLIQFSFARLFAKGSALIATLPGRGRKIAEDGRPA